MDARLMLGALSSEELLDLQKELPLEVYRRGLGEIPSLEQEQLRSDDPNRHTRVPNVLEIGGTLFKRGDILPTGLYVLARHAVGATQVTTREVMNQADLRYPSFEKVNVNLQDLSALGMLAFRAGNSEWEKLQQRRMDNISYSIRGKSPLWRLFDVVQNLV